MAATLRRNALLLALAAPWLLAQRIGVVEGRVTNTIARAPIPGVTVTLAIPDARGQPKQSWSAVTDASGGFRIPDLKPGEYAASFTARGFISDRKTLRVAAATTVALSAELVPLAALRGRVLDDEGGPAPRVRVEVSPSRGGQPTVQNTDNEGRFHFDSLPPGTYLLMARPVHAGSLSKSPDLPEEERTASAPVWFPGFAGREQAESIPVRAGAELSGYEIRLRREPVFRLRGIVLDEEGKRMPRASITLLPPDIWQTQEAQTVSKEDGTFEFLSVRRGSWRLQGESKRGGIALKGFALPVVTDNDLENVELRLSAPFALSGFVDREEPRDAEGNRKLTAISLEPYGWNGSREITFHGQDGRFRFKNVYPGRYTIIPLGFVAGYYLESVRLGDMEVIGKPVDLIDGSLAVRITYKSHAGRLLGTVENGSGSTVVAVPQDEAFLDGQFIRTGKCDGAGRYEIASLRPGEYYAFAFDRIDYQALEDPIFIRNLAARAVAVRVEAGQVTQVDLRVTPWPE